MWIWVFGRKEITQIQGVWEQGTEENNLTLQGKVKLGQRKRRKDDLHNLNSLPNITTVNQLDGWNM